MPSQKKKEIKLSDEVKNEQNIVKEKILEVLLDHDELTKDEISSYAHLKKGSGPWPVVKKPMDELESENIIEICTTNGCEDRRLIRESESAKQQIIIKKEMIDKTQQVSQTQKRSDSNVRSKFTPPKKRGPKPKIWTIKRDISTINKIFNTYPLLQESLWKHEWVRDLIVKNQLNTPQLSAEEIEELKKMLTLSPHFFKLFVNYDDLYELTLEWKTYTDPINNGMSPKEMAKKLKTFSLHAGAPISSYRNLFAFCYFMDEFEGKEERLGYKIVEKYTRERSQTIENSRKSEIFSSIEKVLIPTMKLFFDNIDDKSYKKMKQKHSDVLKKIRLNVQQYTSLSELTKDKIKEPDSEETIDQYSQERKKKFLEILDMLGEIVIIKKFRIN